MGLPTIIVPTYTLTIPSSGKEVKYRPFLVKEEKILLLAMESDKTEEILNATKTIIDNCVYDDLDVDEMPTFDIEYIFLQLRAKAKGEVIDLKYKCPKCEKSIPLDIEIEKIKIHRDKDHTNDIKLNEELGLMMKYPNLKLQQKIAQIAEEQNEIEGLFDTMISCIDYIYDKETTYPSKDHTEKEMKDFLESLTDDQFQKVAKFFDTSPKLKHDIELHCKNTEKKGKGKEKKEKECGYKEKITLEGLNSFFA
tara:strand:- start:9 stop:764 length:756 start_codon:yes stop_codon:yes gene_type:complete